MYSQMPPIAHKSMSLIPSHQSLTESLLVAYPP